MFSTVMGSPRTLKRRRQRKARRARSGAPLDAISVILKVSYGAYLRKLYEHDGRRASFLLTNLK